MRWQWNTYLLFVYFQLLDIMTTIAAGRQGIPEANPLVRSVMSHMGPVGGLFWIKVVMGTIVTACLIIDTKPTKWRVMKFLNYLFAGVVTWNLAALCI